MSSLISPNQRLGRDDLVSFVETEYSQVVASVALMTGDSDGAEDAVQDALAALWQRQDGFRPDNVAAWVTVVAANGSRSTLRRRGAEARAFERLGPSATASNDDAASRVSDAGLISAALAELPDRQRQIAVLYYLGDHSVHDIAVALEVSDGTVKTQLSRARTTLRASLERGDNK